MISLEDISVPFRMQPGLQALDDGATVLHPLVIDSALHRERLGVAPHALLQAPGHSDLAARAALCVHAQTHGLTPVQPDSPQFWMEMSLAFEEDFAILDTHTGLVNLLQVCNPSRWAPEEKIGLHFSAIHAPVADAQHIHRAAPALLNLLSSHRLWRRQVWTITPQTRFDLHPARSLPDIWPATGDPDWLSKVNLRTELQHFLPVPDTAEVVFTIRVMIEPLDIWLMRHPDSSGQLRNSLASMSQPVQAYKGLHLAMPEILKALDRWQQTCAQ